ncbi:MAG: hypothetical protein ACRD3N_04565 [Terracidiphilus sp.]
MFTQIILLMVFTGIGFATAGYHPGAEDDGIYLTAIQSDLNPSLYPHDSQFFRLQLQATVFDKYIAGFVRLTGIPVPWTELLWQFVSILVIVIACWRIASKLFEEEAARWGGVAMVAAMLSLPVAGTALYLADFNLHPRNVASALILLAVWRILARRRWQAVPLLLAAFLFHPIMGAMGVSFCFFLTIVLWEPAPAWLRALNRSLNRSWKGRIGGMGGLAALAPLGWIFAPPSAPWHKALDTRTYYYLYEWTWYEWLGAIAPLVLFWLLWRFARKRGQALLARFALAALLYGVFQQVVAFVMLTPPGFIRLTPLQPMRYLQLIYYFMALIGGALIGKHLLKGKAWRWAIYLAVANGAMLSAQVSLFADCPHLELPGMKTSNPWLQTFAWVRGHTPDNAYFALDPYYMDAKDEDNFSFRALAERSELADAVKDAAVVTQVPELAPEWNREVDAASGWEHFKLADFERLKREFGVDWVLVAYPPPEGLDCRWHDAKLSVCQVP